MEKAGCGCWEWATADPSASLGMTKVGGCVSPERWLPGEGNCRSLGFARDDKGGAAAFLRSVGCWEWGTADPSASLGMTKSGQLRFFLAVVSWGGQLQIPRLRSG